jgi:hypothetical protein
LKNKNYDFVPLPLSSRYRFQAIATLGGRDVLITVGNGEGSKTIVFTIKNNRFYDQIQSFLRSKNRFYGLDFLKRPEKKGTFTIF